MPLLGYGAHFWNSWLPLPNNSGEPKPCQWQMKQHPRPWGLLLFALTLWALVLRNTGCSPDTNTIEFDLEAVLAGL